MKKMKKIGIITFHNTTNYGALFQCYALQKCLNDNNGLCEIVNYNNDHLVKNYDLNPFKSKSIKEFIKKIIYYIPENINKKSFKKFCDNNIKLSKEKYNEYNIKNSNKKYDAFIVGSDQIWNYSLSGNDDNYFLKFCDDNKKKNSYAASFGSKNQYIINKNSMKKLLQEFENLSVREDEMVTILKSDIKEKNIDNSIDPVFLLTMNEWDKLIPNKKKIKKTYIFVYEVARTPLLRDFAKKLAKKYGYEIIYLSKAGKKMKGVKIKYCVSPIEFLSYIKNAKFVVTSSFHGMAFSIIFNKQFYFDTPDNSSEFGSRLDSLSRISNTMERKIVPNFEDNIFNDIEYSLVNVNVNNEIKKSFNYLKKILEENNK